jgi:SRSO17 transposase
VLADIHELDWQAQLAEWLDPFLGHLRHSSQKQWAPVYLQGLLGPGERKSIEPMADRVAPGAVQQLHHFISASTWRAEPLERELVRKAQDLVGGADAVLAIDDTALVKQGRESVGVAHQYCGQLGKSANCQVLVSLTLARREVPVCVGLRLFLPEAWAGDLDRRERAGVPLLVEYQPKWRIALEEIDRVRTAGAVFGCVVADAEYGKVAQFRAGLAERGLRDAVGIPSIQTVYPADVTLDPAPVHGTGRPAKHPVPSAEPRNVVETIDALPAHAWRFVSWRSGTQGRLRARFAAVRVRVADGARRRTGGRLPGSAAWLVCEQRTPDERRYYLTNHPEDTPLPVLVADIKARWVCEQGHQQMKEELGLDHLECRNWTALRHHTVLTMIALCFLQHVRLGGKKVRRRRYLLRAAPATDPAPGPPRNRQGAERNHRAMSLLPHPHPLLPTSIEWQSSARSFTSPDRRWSCETITRPPASCCQT